MNPRESRWNSHSSPWVSPKRCAIRSLRTAATNIFSGPSPGCGPAGGRHWGTGLLRLSRLGAELAFFARVGEGIERPASSADVDAPGNTFIRTSSSSTLLRAKSARPRSDAARTDGTIYASGANHRKHTIAATSRRRACCGAARPKYRVEPTGAQKDDVIYEVDLRGLTRNDSGIPAAVQGTYAGAALKAPYLVGLGITAVEFLPVQEFQNDANDNTPNSTAGQDYWGYETLNYFAPDRRYSFNKAPGGPSSSSRAW